MRQVALLKRTIMTCIVGQRRQALYDDANKVSAPTGVELANAEKLIISAIQQRSYHTEMELLQRSKPDKLKKVAAKSPLAVLCPFVDNAGILRCRGQLQHDEDLDFDAKKSNDTSIQ